MALNVVSEDIGIRLTNLKDFPRLHLATDFVDDSSGCVRVEAAQDNFWVFEMQEQPSGVGENIPVFPNSWRDAHHVPSVLIDDFQEFRVLAIEAF